MARRNSRLGAHFLLIAALVGAALPPATFGRAFAADPDVQAVGPAGSGPTVQPPNVEFANLGQLGTTAVPLRVSWPAGVPGGSPIYRYRLERRLDKGAWTKVTLPSRLARVVTVKTPPSTLIEFRLRAIDRQGMASAWMPSQPLLMAATQENDANVDLSGGWQFVVRSSAYGGRRATTSNSSETATFTFVGSQVAWVAFMGPNQGDAQVSIDGGPATSVDLFRSSGSPRRIAFRTSWPTVGSHTIQITSTGDGPIDVDAFVVLAASATLVGAGDIADCDQTRDTATGDLVETVLDTTGGIAFTSGDNAYPNGTAAEFANCYDPAWGSFKDRTRPTPGNHDYSNPPNLDAAPYFAYFGANAGEPGKGYYTFDAGTWRVYALNSECAPTSACFADQLDWLEADLIAEPHQCTLAIWHRPRFSSGSEHGSSMRMAPVFELLYDEGADLVVVGHDHDYERFMPVDPTGAPDPENGIRQFVVGTGGRSLYTFGPALPITEARNNNTWGVLRLDLVPGAYSWEFLRAAGGTFTDSGAGSCH